MAAANKGSPIYLVGPFPEGAMGPITQRPGHLYCVPQANLTTTRAWLYPSSKLEVIIGRLFKHRTCGVHKQLANCYKIFLFKGTGSGKELDKTPIMKKEDLGP